MEDPTFDPSGFYEFDLSRGKVSTRDGERVFVLSDDVVAPLLGALVKQGDLSALEKLGTRLADHALSSLGGRASEMPPEAVLSHAAGVMGLYGWGRLSFERWGDVLVVTAGGLADLDAMQLATASLLSGLLSKLSGQAVRCVPAGEERFFVVHPSIAERVSSWVSGGADLATVAQRLRSEDA